MPTFEDWKKRRGKTVAEVLEERRKKAEDAANGGQLTSQRIGNSAFEDWKNRRKEAEHNYYAAVDNPEGTGVNAASWITQRNRERDGRLTLPTVDKTPNEMSRATSDITFRNRLRDAEADERNAGKAYREALRNGDAESRLTLGSAVSEANSRKRAAEDNIAANSEARTRESYATLNQNEDFAKLSQPDPELIERGKTAPDFGGFLGSKGTNTNLYYNVNAGRNADRSAVMSGSVAPGSIGSYAYMDDDEVANFNYLFKKQGSDAARAYYDHITPELNQRRMMRVENFWVQNAQEHPAAASLVSVGTNLAGIAGIADLAVQNAQRRLTGSDDPVDYNRGAMMGSKITSAIRDTVSQDIAQNHPKEIGGANVASFLYQTGMSMADSAVIAGLSVLGIPGASALLGGSAATQSALEVKERGGTDAQALGYGIAAGIAESLFEELSLEKLLKPTARGLAAGVRNVLRQALTEGSEEVSTTIANTLTDRIINGDLSQLNVDIRRYQELGYSDSDSARMALSGWLQGLAGDFLGGFISGFGMSGAKVAGTNVAGAVQDARTAGLKTRYEQVLNAIRNSAANPASQETSAEPSETAVNPVVQSAEPDVNPVVQGAETVPNPVVQGSEPGADQTAERTAAATETVSETALDNAVRILDNGEPLSGQTVRRVMEDAQSMETLQRTGALTEDVRPGAEGRRQVADAVGRFRDMQNTARAEAAQRAAQTRQDANLLTQTRANDTIAENGDTPNLEGAIRNVEQKAEEKADAADGGLLATAGRNEGRNEAERAGDAGRESADRRAERGTGVADEGTVRAVRGESAKRFLQNFVQQRSYRAAANRAAEIRAAAKSAGLREVSSEELGLANGTDTKQNALLTKDLLTRDMRRKQEQMAREGIQLDYVIGLMETTEQNGDTVLVRGAASTDGKHVWVTANHSRLDSGRIADHEYFHIMQARDNTLVQRTKNAIANDPNLKGKLQELMDRYTELYAPYGLNADEIEEEMLADYYAGYDATGLLDADRETAKAVRSEVERQRSYETNGNNPASHDINPGFAEAKFSIEPPYRRGTIDERNFYNGLSDEAKRTYNLFRVVHTFGEDNMVEMMVGSGKKAHLSPVNITMRYMTVQEWNKNVRNNPEFARVARGLYQRLGELNEMGVDEGGVRDGDAARVPVGDMVRLAARFSQDGTFAESRQDESLKIESAFIQRVIDSLPERKSESTIRIAGKNVRVSKQDGGYMAIGGNDYRRAIIDTRRKMYSEGKLPYRSISAMSKDNWGAMGFLAANGKTGASGDFTTFCPQMMFNNGCFYCYRLSALTSGVNNKLTGRNVWYSGEILQMKPEDIEMLNANGGLRIQSFGDWQDMYSEELADMLIDADMRGLQVKIITKEPTMIEAVALLKSQGIGKNLYFNLSADYTLEMAGAIQNQGNENVSPMNPNRPLVDIGGTTWWKRAMSVQEAAYFRATYPWVNTRIVATNIEEFIRGLRSEYVDVVTGYHGKIKDQVRISSETGEMLLEVEAIGDAGMPRFGIRMPDGTTYGVKDPNRLGQEALAALELDPKKKAQYERVKGDDYDLKSLDQALRLLKKGGEWVTTYPGKTKMHKALAQRVQDEGLQMAYFAKVCCQTGRCSSCAGKCGLLAQDPILKNLTNRDPDSLDFLGVNGEERAWWLDHLYSTRENILLDSDDGAMRFEGAEDAGLKLPEKYPKGLSTKSRQQLREAGVYDPNAEWVTNGKSKKNSGTRLSTEAESAGLSDVTDDSSSAAVNDVRFSRETDPVVIDRLEAQLKKGEGKGYIVTYRTCWRGPDGNLYSPMASVQYDENGKPTMSAPFSEEGWYVTDYPKNIEAMIENGSLLYNKDASFSYVLKKADVKADVPAAFNPLLHTSPGMLNDQFAIAYKRHGLVVVKCLVPMSEIDETSDVDPITGEYRTERFRPEFETNRETVGKYNSSRKTNPKGPVVLPAGTKVTAKDTTGLTNWSAGVVTKKVTGGRDLVLSRWIKHDGIVPNREAAKVIAKWLRDGGFEGEIPANVVTPDLRKYLEREGLKFGAPADAESKGYYEEMERIGLTKAQADGTEQIPIDFVSPEPEFAPYVENLGENKSKPKKSSNSRKSAQTKLSRELDKETEQYLSKTESSRAVRYSREVNTMTYFSGGGTVDKALEEITNTQLAVEYDDKIADVYRLNNGELFQGDVRDIDPNDYVGKVDYFHASPVCKDYSRMNRDRSKLRDGNDDITTAVATAETIRVIKPKVFTLENVEGYKGSSALSYITDALNELGYKWDADVYNAYDYGGAISRERYLLRAVRDGDLPDAPERVKGYSWNEATADLIGNLEETHVPNWIQDRLDRTDIDYSKPFLFLGGTNGGVAWIAKWGEPCPSITTTVRDARIFYPNDTKDGYGRVLRCDRNFFKRIMGLPDNYDISAGSGVSQDTAYKVVGNAVPAQLTQKFFGNLLDTVFETGVRFSREFNPESIAPYTGGYSGSGTTVGGGRKVSRVRSNALEVSNFFDPVEAEMDGLRMEDYTYKPESEKETIAEAKRRIADDFDGWSKKLSKEDRQWDGKDVDTAMGILYLYRQEARFTGDYRRVVDFSHVIQKHGTMGGKEIQAFAKYSRTATYQVQKAAEKLIKENDLNPADEKKVNETVRMVDDIIEQESKKAAEDAMNTLTANANSPDNRKTKDALNLLSEIYEQIRVQREHGEPVENWVEMTGEELAKRISGRMKEPKAKAKTTMQIVLGDLMKFAEEHALPKNAVPKSERTAMYRLADYLNNRPAYESAWSTSQRILREQYADVPAVLEALDAFLTGTIPYNGDQRHFDRTMFDAILETADGIGMDAQRIRDLTAVGLRTQTIERIADELVENVRNLTDKEITNEWEPVLRDSVIRHIRGILADSVPQEIRLGQMMGKTAKELNMKFSELLTKSKGDKRLAAAQLTNWLVSDLGLRSSDAAIASKTVTDAFMEELANRSEKRLQSLFREKDVPLQKEQRNKLMELFRLGGFSSRSVEDAVVDALGIGNVSREKQREIMSQMAQFADTLDAIYNGDSEAVKSLIRQQAAVRKTKLSKSAEKALEKEHSFDYLYDFAMTQLKLIAGDFEKRTLGSKLSTIQTMNHLLNLLTAFRNLTSNQVFDLVASAANNVAIIPDIILSAATGKRTVGLNKSWASKAKRQGAIQGARRNLLEVALDVDPSANDSSKYGTKGRDTFAAATSKGIEKAFNFGEQIMGYELNTTDEFHKGSVRGETLESIQKYMDRGDITEEDARQIIEYEARYRAFQDDTLVGNVMSGAKQLLNIVGLGDSGKTLGKFKVKDWGPGDFVVKYTQVPGALIHRAIEFSPLGYAKAAYHIVQMRNALKSGTSTTIQQRKAALAIGQATTGTGLILLFMTLAKAGLLKIGDKDKDKNALAQKTAQGLSGTQLNVSALARALNGEKITLEDGDVLADIGFLEPLDTLMTISALLADEEEFGVKNVTGDTIEGIWRALEDTSAMQSIATIINTVQYHDEENDLPLYMQIPIELAKDGLSGLIVPSAVRQAAQATDTVYRDQYRTKNLLEQTAAGLANSVPGLRKTLAPKITPLGDEKTYQRPWLNALNATLNPGNISVYRANKVTDELDRVFAETEDDKIWPERNAPYTVTVGKNQYTLTGDERTQFQRTRGGSTSEMIEEVIKTGWYQKLGADTKAEMLNWIGNFANYLAKAEMLEGRGEDYSSAAYEKYAAMIGSESWADIVKSKYGQTVGLIDAGLTEEQAEDVRAMDNTDKRDYLLKSDLNDEEKLSAYGILLGTNMTTESGAPSQWANLNTAIDDGLSVDDAISLVQSETLDDYMKWRGSDAKEAGINSEVYIKYRVDTAKIGADKDSSGKAISGSKKAKVVEYINKLKLTPKQKDALYRDAGYAEKNLPEMPWNNSGLMLPIT